jgi:hypothetical protein
VGKIGMVSLYRLYRGVVSHCKSIVALNQSMRSFCFQLEASGREIVRPHDKNLLHRNSGRGNLGDHHSFDVLYRPLDTP